MSVVVQWSRGSEIIHVIHRVGNCMPNSMYASSAFQEDRATTGQHSHCQHMLYDVRL